MSWTQGRLCTPGTREMEHKQHHYRWVSSLPFLCEYTGFGRVGSQCMLFSENPLPLGLWKQQQQLAQTRQQLRVIYSPARPPLPG
mmetsp:Transcript_7733/g.17832  ORF Transcript_7733/g.17832 Transcript_7733/m.17832 type:complete len:85 (+) Transcript_7733:1096-1350(+)